MQSLIHFVQAKHAAFRADAGSSFIELALTIPLFILLLCGVVDFGRAYFMAMEVAGAAQAGASYGSQNPTDITGIQNAAQQDAPDVTGLTVGTPTYGCECSDGTNFVASCASKPTCTHNVVYRVSVTASTNYQPLIPWPGIPSNINISRTAVMRGSTN
ncbi:MAG TPA: TadE/TadG family type IV pilus assembly protein [Terracidiphilus sp.]|jgi:Flp pilus assembly protein TadG|nr:TadE/TadG family type IV pilus assembly protein [Terracidiphilus sp.]